MKPCHASSTARDGIPITTSSRRAAPAQRSHWRSPISISARGSHGQVFQTAGGSATAATARSTAARSTVRRRSMPPGYGYLVPIMSTAVFVLFIVLIVLSWVVNGRGGRRRRRRGGGGGAGFWSTPPNGPF